jgi:geranylgeranyl diphosphate synthase type II
MLVGRGSAARDFRAYWADLQARYETLLPARHGLEAPLSDVAGYALARGQRLRPLLAELTGRALGAPPAAVTAVAVAVEYLHTASVLLDDLPCMDDAPARRGDLPAHRRFSEAEAVLAAVALTSRGYALLLAAPGIEPAVTGAMARRACETVAGAMAPGQAAELERAATASPEAVRRIHERKTATLFALAASLTAACAGADAGRTAGVVAFATLLGRAYQILDDVDDRDQRGEARVNLAHVVGPAEALAEARGLLQAARHELEAFDGDGGAELGACVDWFERRLDALVNDAAALSERAG